MNDIFETIRPVAMKDAFDATVEPIEDVTPLKEGDKIDLNGLELEVFNFFGHTMDSIALLDEKNRNIFTGDAILNKSGDLYVQPTFMPPEFNESEILKTFQKLRDIKDKLNSIAIAHYGVYKDGDFEIYLEEMEEIHFKTKSSIIQWYKENLSSREIALKYYGTYISSSEKLENEALDSLEMNIRWLIEGLKLSGFI
jgi:glyoxylase-like metal-dependent hydrolase (beta-lactamase superfamily II)